MSGWDQSAVECGIAETRFAGRVQHLVSVGSTNSLAMEAAQTDLRNGVWVADEQTAGRGRGGHGWHSAAGEGLYVSALVTLRVPADRAMWISLATGLAARAAIRDVSGLTPDIRWPNDLLLNGRKCGGILIESSMPAAQSGTQAIRFAVIGVGINVNHTYFPEELAGLATSLRLECGRNIVREMLLVELLRRVHRELERLDEEIGRTSFTEGVLERFAQASTWVRGKRVRVGEDGSYTGMTAGLNAGGFLLVDTDAGVRRTVLSGGVREPK